jgi:hypothetical protein
MEGPLAEPPGAPVHLADTSQTALIKAALIGVLCNNIGKAPLTLNDLDLGTLLGALFASRARVPHGLRQCAFLAP